MRKIDFNCDMGESSPLHAYNIQHDLDMLNYVSSINIACGMHAGDANTMHILTEAALEKGVAIGAHPSYPDLENFGRKNMSFTPSQVYDFVLYQVGALHAFLHVYGARLHHVKPHGALYNMAAKERALADVIALAIQEFDKDIVLYGLSGSELINAARAHGIRSCSEVFADRTYQEDGSLTPRTAPRAVIDELNECIAQVMMIVKERKVKSVTGQSISIVADTICLHGDNTSALKFAVAISDHLKSGNVLIQQP
jgi:5-oxoprolinase (ATP-hydrolysing) subunit A